MLGHYCISLLFKRSVPSEPDSSNSIIKPVRSSVSQSLGVWYHPAGTGPEVFGNTNAPPAVTYSAIIYALRCMVPQEIPLNQVWHAVRGCLLPC